MCLLGADHRSAPHTLASLPALQRTEVLEWAKLPGAHSPQATCLPGLTSCTFATLPTHCTITGPLSPFPYGSRRGVAWGVGWNV